MGATYNSTRSGALPDRPDTPRQPPNVTEVRWGSTSGQPVAPETIVTPSPGRPRYKIVSVGGELRIVEVK